MDRSRIGRSGLVFALLPILLIGAGCADPNHHPTIDPIPDQQIRVGETLRLPIPARDPDSDRLVYKATPRPDSASFEVIDGVTNFV